METFAARLNRAMEMRGMKQVDLANKTGLSKSQISKYVNGIIEATQTPLYKLAIALNVSEPWLMGCDVPMARMDKETDPLQSLSDGEKSVIEALRSMTKEKQDLIITLLGNLQDD